MKKFLNSIFGYHPEQKYEFSLQETNLNNNSTNDNLNTANKCQSIYTSLAVNLEYLKVKYNTLINSDINIREFILTAHDKQYQAFLIYIDGMINSQIVNDFVLEPLMIRNRSNTYAGNEVKFSTAVASNISVRKVKKFNLEDYIYNSLIPQNSINKISEFSSIISDINSGNCALFIDTIPVAFSIEVKGFKTRSIAPPNNEVVVRGAQEAFIESIRVNTTLLRRIVNNENLIIENTSIGKITKTKIAICYMKNIANDDLVAEVKYRINNLSIDSLVSSRSIRTTDSR